LRLCTVGERPKMQPEVNKWEKRALLSDGALEMNVKVPGGSGESQNCVWECAGSIHGLGTVKHMHADVQRSFPINCGAFLHLAVEFCRLSLLSCHLHDIRVNPTCQVGAPASLLHCNVLFSFVIITFPLDIKGIPYFHQRTWVLSEITEKISQTRF
jgi:hypothetical protein